MKALPFSTIIIILCLFTYCNKAYYHKKDLTNRVSADASNFLATISFRDSILTVSLTNVAKKPLYIDTVYNRYFIGFEPTHPIYKSGIAHVTSETIYPVITYQNKKIRQRFIANNCANLFNSRLDSNSNLFKNVLMVQPDSSYKKQINIFSAYYIERFERNLKYKMSMTVYLPEGCKTFFPCISTGYIRSDTIQVNFK